MDNVTVVDVLSNGRFVELEFDLEGERVRATYERVAWTHAPTSVLKNANELLSSAPLANTFRRSRR